MQNLPERRKGNSVSAILSAGGGILELVIKKIVELLEEKGAENIKVLDLRSFNYITDYFVIATLNSPPHFKAVIDHLMEAIDRGELPFLHIEGEESNFWVLLDLDRVMVHLMSPEARLFYQLEKLWMDAPVVMEGGNG